MLQSLLKNDREKALFKSYWVHPILQLVIIGFFLFIRQDQNVVLALYIFLEYYLAVLALLLYQFPLTGFFIVWSDRITQQVSTGQGLLFRVVLSTGCFVLMASLFLLIFFHIFTTIVFKGFVLGDSIRFMMTYITPVLFTGELLRQRLVLKKVY